MYKCIPTSHLVYNASEEEYTVYIHIIQVVPYYGYILRGNTKKIQNIHKSSSIPHDEIRRKLGMLSLTISQYN